MPHRQSAALVWLSVAVAIVIAISLFHTTRTIRRNVVDACFAEMRTAADLLAEELSNNVETDRSVLHAMSHLIAGGGTLEPKAVCEIMNSFDITDSRLTRVVLLTPDNRLICQDGTVADARGMLNFPEEAAKGVHLTGKEHSIINPADTVIRSAMPVVRDGETIAVLYGAVSLSRLVEHYTTRIYGGQAYVYVVDGDTGDFLLDTWHKNLGNLFDYAGRKTPPGYSFDQMHADIAAGRAGLIAFVSKTVNETLYMYYAPAGVNNWNIAITVAERVAFSESREIYSALIVLAVVEGVTLLAYMAAVVAYLMRANRTILNMGIHDPTTGAQNRSAYEARASAARDKVFRKLLCIYADVNGLHEYNNQFGHTAGDAMLKAVADSLIAEFTYENVYRVGDDEFIVLLENGDCDGGKEKAGEAVRRIGESGYSVSIGLVQYENERGIERAVKAADSLMLQNKSAYYAHHDRRRRQ